MTAPLFTPAAERDLRVAARWIAQDDPASAEALLRAELLAARRLRERPGLGRLREDLAPPRYQFWPLSGFRYLLVCDTEAVPPHFVRVVQTSRDLPYPLRDISLDPL